jgi:hypothetical protein
MTAATENFFDRFPLFLETTGTRRLPNRLNQRYKLLIDANRSALRGARVLDIASHDGRWSMAALDAGAAYVEGVEGRQELVDRSRRTFAHYGIPNAKYAFEQGDALPYVRAIKDGAFDVIFCFGFYYHILEHFRFAMDLVAINPKLIVLDTGVSLSDAPIIELQQEESKDFRNSIGHPESDAHRVPVGRPSRRAIGIMFEYLGWTVKEVPVASYIDDWAECEQYKEGRRTTFLITKTRNQ